MSSYVPLWCKSNFSFLEGANHPNELVEEAQQLGLLSLALTDRDGVYGIVRAHGKAQELGPPSDRSTSPRELGFALNPAQCDGGLAWWFNDCLQWGFGSCRRSLCLVSFKVEFYVIKLKPGAFQRIRTPLQANAIWRF
jgi:PHP domain